MTHQKFFSDSKYRWFGLAANLVLVVTWYLANDGLAFWDDYSYLNLANTINEGSFTITSNHFTSRVALLYPVAWIIEHLGINQFSITVFPLICGLLTLNILLWVGNLYHHWLGVFAATFFVCDYHVITFVTHLFPEMPMTLYTLAALVAYDRVNRKEGDHRLWALVLSTSIFLAFLTKMTVIVLGPLFVYLFVNDYWLKRTNRSFWLISVVLLLFFVLANGFWYQEVYGDFFYRFSNISDNHEATSKTFFDKSALTILKRLTYLPLLGFMRGGFFIPLLFALPAVITLKKSDWKVEDPDKLWPVATVFILGTWWFMSTNWKYYSPMPVDTRHITLLIPVMLVAGGMYWTKTHLLSAIRYSSVRYLLTLLLVIPIYKVATANDRNFKGVEVIFNDVLSPESEAATVFTDGLISYGYPYFYELKPVNLNFVWFSEMNGSQPENGDYLLLNPAYFNDRYNDAENLERFKKQIENLGLKLELVSRGDVQLFKLVK